MDDRDADIRGLVTLLRRRLGLILASFAICLGLSGAVLVLLTPVYSATALVLVDPSRSGLVDNDAQAARPLTDGARVDSEVEILRSDAVLLDVIAGHNLQDDPQFAVRPNLGERVGALLGRDIAEPPQGELAMRHVLSRLRDALSVQRRGVTYLIAVQARSADPHKAADLANAVAEAYVDGQMRAKLDNILAASAVLDARLALARENIIEAEEALDGLIAANMKQAAAQPGSAIARLQDDLERLTRSREHLQGLSLELAAGAERRDWALVAARLQSETLDLSIAMADLAGDVSLTDAALGQRVEAVIARIGTELAALDEQAEGLRQLMRADLLGGGLPVERLAEIYEAQ